MHKYFLHTVAFALACAAGIASAQTFPDKPVRVVIPYAPGGGTDNLVRVIAPTVGASLGQQLVIENRPGGASIIATEIVAKAAPDGYTVLATDSALLMNPGLFKAKMPFDTQKSFSGLTMMASAPVILVIHPSVPANSLSELLALARSRPGHLNYASGGYGTSTHLAAELMKLAAKVFIVHIPYKGTAPAMIDMVAGQVATMAATILTGMPQIRAGRLRPLGITSAVRSPIVPDLPTVAEAGLPGYESVQWYGMLAPARTPRDIITRLHGEATRVLQQPEIKARFAGDGADPVGSTPEEFTRYIQSELTKWAKVARDAGIQQE